MESRSEIGEFSNEEPSQVFDVMVDFTEPEQSSKRKRDGFTKEEERERQVLNQESLKASTGKRFKDFDKIEMTFEITPEQAEQIYKEEKEKKERGKVIQECKNIISEMDYEKIKAEALYLANTPSDQKPIWKKNIWEIVIDEKIPDYLKQMILRGQEVYINGETYQWVGALSCPHIKDKVQLH